MKNVIPYGIQMGYMSRKNIKVSEETFEELSNDKPDGVTWDRYLSDMLHWAKGTSEPAARGDEPGEWADVREQPDK